MIAVEAGLRLLICSDGLTKELTAYGIRHFMVANQKPEKAARQLVEAALGNGGRDNVTVVVVDVLKVVRPPGYARRAPPENPTSTDGGTSPVASAHSAHPQLRSTYNGGTGRPPDSPSARHPSSGRNVARRLPSTPPNLPGFAFIRVLGSGGFADVFLYEQNMPRRLVAVKVMLAEVVNDRSRQMFQAEANLMAQLSLAPVDPHRVPGERLGRRPPIPGDGVCSATLGQRYRANALPRRRGAVDRRADRAARSRRRTGRESSTATSSRRTS